MPKPKLIRITTVPISLNILLKGQLAFMRDHFEVLAVSSGPQEELDEVSRREGVPNRKVEMTRAITPVQDLKAVWQLYQLFKKEQPQIVHTHTPKAGIVGLLAARLAGVPHRLHTVAGLPLLEATGAKRKLLDFVEKITYRCATKIYPNSQGLYDIIIEKEYTKTSKLKVIANGSSNGIDTTHFSPKQVSEAEKTALREKLGISSRDFVFVFVGRLVGDKGINELIDAFVGLNSLLLGKGAVGEAKLLLVGPLETDLDALQPETLLEIESNPNIVSVGYQKDVRPYFAISNTLVFPSYREGFPNVVMQAGAMNIPAIVSNINGCNEIIKEGKNGTIIPVKDSGAILEKMSQFLMDKPYYNSLKKKSREMICDRYEHNVVCQAILKEYRTL